jgi:hypothetical protein
MASQNLADDRHSAWDRSTALLTRGAFPLVAQEFCLRQKAWTGSGDLLSDLGLTGVTGSGVRVPVAVPRRSVAQQQTLLVGSADQILERHPVPFLRRGRRLADEALQQAVAQFS